MRAAGAHASATPSLRANAAIQAQWGPLLASARYDERYLPPGQKAGQNVRAAGEEDPVAAVSAVMADLASGLGR